MARDLPPQRRSSPTKRPNDQKQVRADTRPKAERNWRLQQTPVRVAAVAYGDGDLRERLDEERGEGKLLERQQADGAQQQRGAVERRVLDLLADRRADEGAPAGEERRVQLHR
eukprot:2147416-Prymnesium_polylepis.2